MNAAGVDGGVDAEDAVGGVGGGVGVVMTVYNEPAHAIVPALDALRHQSLKPRSIVVVDDGSTSPLVLAHNELVTVLRLDTNRGISAARNDGCSRLDTEFVLFVNAHVLLDERWLELGVTRLKAEPAAVVVSGRIALSSHRRWRSTWRLRHLENQQQTGDQARDCSYLVGHALLVRVAALRAVGGFRPDLRRAGEDFDICRRFRDAGFRVLYDPGLYATVTEEPTLRALGAKSIRNNFWNLASTEHDDGSLRALRPVKALVDLWSETLTRMSRDIARRRWTVAAIDPLVGAAGTTLVVRRAVSGRVTRRRGTAYPRVASPAR